MVWPAPQPRTAVTQGVRPVANNVQEISEADASGPIAAIYADLKATQRVPMIALIYRHLAAVPGTLEWAWRVLEPIMANGALPESARLLVERLPVIDMAALTDGEAKSFGLRPLDRAAIAYILAVYETTNSCNLIAVRVLRRCLEEEQPSTGTPRPRAGGAAITSGLPPLPAPVAVDTMPDDLLNQIMALRPPNSRIVPTLYRHLAPWPAYLADMVDRLTPPFRDGDVARASDALADAGNKVAADFVDTVRAHDLAEGRPSGGDARLTLVKTLDDFAATIPEMIVVGRLLRAALP
jgi:hypothetical protein